MIQYSKKPDFIQILFNASKIENNFNLNIQYSFEFKIWMYFIKAETRYSWQIHSKLWKAKYYSLYYMILIKNLFPYLQQVIILLYTLLAVRSIWRRMLLHSVHPINFTAIYGRWKIRRHCNKMKFHKYFLIWTCGKYLQYNRFFYNSD